MTDFERLKASLGVKAGQTTKQSKAPLAELNRRLREKARQ